MGLEDYINKIDQITDKISNSESEKDNDKSNVIKESFSLIINVIVDFIKLPLKFLTNFFKKELISAIRKDAKLYALVMGIMGVLFVFFSVLWLFISIAVGVYYYEKGETILNSILFSIAFQFISFIIIGSIAFFATKKIKSLQMLKNADKIKI